MANFPTLAVGPDTATYNVEYAVDPVFRNKTDDGKVITRRKYTWTPKIFRFDIRGLTATERTSIVTFYEVTTNFGSDEFDWVCPEDNVTLHVICNVPPKFIMDESNLPEKNYVCSLELIQTRP